MNARAGDTDREQMHARAGRAEERSGRHVRSLPKKEMYEKSTCRTYQDKEVAKHMGSCGPAEIRLCDVTVTGQWSSALD